MLADDALHQALFHFHQLLALAFLQARNRDVRPTRNDLGDVFLGHFLAEEARLFVGRFFLCDLAQFLFQLGNAAVLDFTRFAQFSAALRAFEFGAGGVEFFFHLRLGVDL